MLLDGHRRILLMKVDCRLTRARRAGREAEPGQVEKVRSTRRSAPTLESIGDAVICTNLAGQVSYLNAAAEAMTGWARWNAMGRPAAEVLRLIDRETRASRESDRLGIGLDRTVGFANGLVVRRDGHETEIEHTVGPIHDRNGQATGVVIVLRDVGAATRRRDGSPTWRSTMG